MWRFACATAIGTSHIRTRTPCQDRCAVKPIHGRGHDVLVGIISDGASSASQAAAGAETVCNALLRVVSESLSQFNLHEIDDVLVRKWFTMAHTDVQKRATGADFELREFSATGLLAVVDPDLAVCAQVGDGAILVREDNSATDFRIVVWPKPAVTADQTSFVSNPLVSEHIVIRRFKKPRDLVMFSDGLEPIALSVASKKQRAAFAAPLVKLVRDPNRSNGELGACLEHYLRSAATSEATDDDTSLLIACRL